MSERLRILNMIETGEITPEKGARMLEELTEKNGKAEGDEANEQMRILEKIESGEISPDEGINMLQKPEGETEIIDSPLHTGRKEKKRKRETPPEISTEEMKKWKRWWVYPMYLGIGITGLSVYWMNSAIQKSGYGFWFICSWLPMLIGIALIALSWHSQTGTWLHVRVKSPEQRVSVSLPVPIRLTAWGLRIFGKYIPQMENTALDEVILAFDTTAKNGTPFYVHVDEGEGGEQVEVFIG